MSLERTARSQAIARHLVKVGSASITELANHFGVSTMTVHRDLAELEQQSVIRRYRGGATAQPSSVFESNIDYRMSAMQQEKAAIAEVACSLVEPGMSVTLDEGSTALAVARGLTRIAPLTVVTHFLGAMTVLRALHDIDIVGVGGVYSRNHDAFLGLQCVESMASLRTDILFLSTSAVCDDLAFHQEQDVVAVKRAMMNAATKRVLIVDSSKFKRTALHRFAELAAFDLVITDWRVSQDVLDQMSSMDVSFQVADAQQRPIPTRREPQDREEDVDTDLMP